MKICTARVSIFFIPLLITTVATITYSLYANAITFPSGSPPPFTVNKKTPLDKPLALPVNINTADAKTLRRVPGINRTAARQIVNYRDRNGKYSNLDELVGYSGISSASIDQLHNYLSVQ